uniref:Serpentine receptor class gamma n=1 Tax=Panagrellus redivivus TaxID=6233 RepID=A0A7E4W929_PANRE
MDPNQLPLALLESGHQLLVWYSFEAVFNLITVINGIVMISAFMKFKYLHLYFRTVCINVFVVSILRSTFRFLIFTTAFIIRNPSPLPYFIVAAIFTNIAVNLSQTFVIIERLWSSLRVNVYESYKSRIVVLLFIILPFAIAFICQFLVFGVQVLPRHIFKWATIVLNSALWAWFYAFWQYTSWRNSKKRPSWKLNARYQQKENLEISVTMKWFGCYCSIQSLFVSANILWKAFDSRVQNYSRYGRRIYPLFRG